MSDGENIVVDSTPFRTPGRALVVGLTLATCLASCASMVPSASEEPGPLALRQADDPQPRFRILGRVRLHSAEGETGIAGAKARAFLVVMLLRANEMVSLQRICDALWDGEPPRSGTANIRTYAHLLRRMLGHSARLISHPGGYELHVADRDRDHIRFLELAAAGRRALTEGATEESVRLLESALRLWDGDQAAVGIARNGPLQSELDHLDQERIRTTADLAEAYLRLGEARAALRDLRELLAIAPTSSRGWALCMRAYQVLGEPHNVEHVYRQAVLAYRRHLDLPVDQELHRLYRQIMRG